ncbi:IS256 family transposase [Alkalibacillus almallahensis]|uniref:IS256 family transposase n=1 Tax=Alkalibacillus almallahensis TaxID=1379154 RepID=UPI001421CAF8|nr:IS256 family transposase [Alkalibacillus almallahensis]NIK11771.1 putative transposase [Alkalibacillus almallahensis]
MSNSMSENNYFKPLEELVLNFVKDHLEEIMKEEMKNFFDVEHPELKNSKNGFYERLLDTRYGRIDDLSVPRDREGCFQTALFDPYQRRERWLGETIIEMYSKGVSTREIAQFIERMLGDSYSASTISNITDVVVEDIQKWQKRPLSKRYSVLYLDGTYLKLRRHDVASEVIYVVVGITEEGYKEIISFQVGGQESSLGWKEVLADLRDRGVEEVLLGVFDGLTGLDASFKEMFPKADVQRCVTHKVRNTLHNVRKTDRETLVEDLKKVYRADTTKEALAYFDDFKGSWQSIYPKVIESWEDDLNELLTFMKYPKEIQPQIYTTNTIERTMKEIKKRTRSMNSLPSEQAVEKIIYLVTQNFNERWAKRVITEFASAREKLSKMFKKRYEA